MRSDDVDATARSCDPIQLSDKGHNVRHMFSDVAADNLIKFAVRERIGNDAEVMNHIGMAFGRVPNPESHAHVTAVLGGVVRVMEGEEPDDIALVGLAV